MANAPVLVSRSRLREWTPNDFIPRSPCENHALSREVPCDLTPAKENRSDCDLRFGRGQKKGISLCPSAVSGTAWTWKCANFSKNFSCEPHGQGKETYLVWVQIEYVSIVSKYVWIGRQYGLDWFWIRFRHPLRLKRIRGIPLRFDPCAGKSPRLRFAILVRSEGKKRNPDNPHPLFVVLIHPLNEGLGPKDLCKTSGFRHTTRLIKGVNLHPLH